MYTLHDFQLSFFHENLYTCRPFFANKCVFFVSGDQESYEMDVSSRGRLRKRRVIPNNVEDQAKKRKVTNTTVTTASEHIPNILQRQSKTGQGSSLVTNLDQLKVLNIGGGIGLNSAGQILLQTTNTGSHALVTGLTPQAIASLRLGTKGTVIVPSTQQMKTPQKSQTQTRFMSMSSKQASHPVIQGLLSTRQPNILQKSGTNKAGAATLANQTGTTPINGKYDNRIVVNFSLYNHYPGQGTVIYHSGKF